MMFYRHKRNRDNCADYCKECSKEKSKKYIEANRISTKKWRDKNKGYFTRNYYKYKDKYKEKQRAYHKVYIRTPHGKLIAIKKSHKHRKKGFILLLENIFPDDIEIDYHHVFKNMGIVIPMPRITHRYVEGKNHFKFNLNKIKEIYCMDVEKLLNEDIEET
jgi:hypothetical protein